MEFTLQAKDPESRARAGILHTVHGLISTPIFMPVGTAASVKTVQQYDLEDSLDADIILSNTYHLYLRPGIEIIRQAGGLHRFMSWSRPILTDSGGYQVYSLSAKRKITEEGVTFSSHIDGSRHTFTPESAIDIQRQIGADVIMAFDECTPYPCPYDYARESMELTHRWLTRCCRRFDAGWPLYGHGQILAPIVQGSVYTDLREESAHYVAEQDSTVNAIGGLSVGEPHEMMYEMTDKVCAILPEQKARYLMGVGTPANLLECISLGVDMFDCVMPTRNARHGLLYTREGVINIRNAKWKTDFTPIDEVSDARVDRYYSKAYLRHLFLAREYLALQIASLHNLSFYLWLVREARKRILDGDYRSWKEEMMPVLSRRL